MGIILIVEENNFVGPRDYKKMDIEGVVLIKSKKYFGNDDGWMSEPIDFSELTYFLGRRFEPKSIHMFQAPVGVIRGGHLEGRSKSVTVTKGKSFVVLVNMRPGDDQGKAISFYLGEGKETWGNTVLVPEGVLMSAIAMTEDCFFVAVADRPFNRFDSLLTLDMFDPKLGVKWPEGTQPQKREKESKFVKLDEFLQNI